MLTRRPLRISRNAITLRNWTTSRVWKGIICFVIVLAIVTIPLKSIGQWQVVFLGPNASAYGNDGTMQVGMHVPSGTFWKAAVWSGSASSLVSLHPQTAVESLALEVDGNLQVGSVRYSGGTLGGPWRAALWNGTASSIIDLTPPSATVASASGIKGNEIVGSATVPTSNGNGTHASIWSKVAGVWTWKDVHPANGPHSGLYATDGVQQVGSWTPGSSQVLPRRAGLWTGTVQSFVDLHPTGAWFSEANGVDRGQQVGTVTFIPAGNHHAGFWTGNASSWVDLHPFTYGESDGEDVHSGYQVGNVEVGGTNIDHASLWNGSVSTWEDLHLYLPSGFSVSRARGIDATNNMLCVVGEAVGSSGRQAVMWCRPLPNCAKRISQFSADDGTQSLPFGEMQVVAYYDGTIDLTLPRPKLWIEMRNPITNNCCVLDVPVNTNSQIVTHEYQMLSGFEPTGRVAVRNVIPNGTIDGIAFGIHVRSTNGDRWTIRSVTSGGAFGLPNFSGGWPVAWSEMRWDNMLSTLNYNERRRAQSVLYGAQMLTNGDYSFAALNHIPGDLNFDGCVDSMDEEMWRENAKLPRCRNGSGPYPLPAPSYTPDRFGALPSDRMQVVAVYDGNVNPTAPPSLSIECRHPTTLECFQIAVPVPSSAGPNSIVAEEFVMNGFEPTGRVTVGGVLPNGVIDGVAFGLYVRDVNGDRWILKSGALGLATGNFPNFIGGWPVAWNESTWDSYLPQMAPFLPVGYDEFVARRQAQMTLAGAQMLPNGTFDIPNSRFVNLDIDEDGTVNRNDFAILINNLGQGCCH